MKRNMMQNILHDVEKDWSSTATLWAARDMKTTFLRPNLSWEDQTGGVMVTECDD